MITIKKMLEEFSSTNYQIQAGYNGLEKKIQCIRRITNDREFSIVDKQNTLLILEQDVLLQVDTLTELEKLFYANHISSIIVTIKNGEEIQYSQLKSMCNHYQRSLVIFNGEISSSMLFNNIFDFLYDLQDRPRRLIENDYIELIQLVTHDRGLKKLINVAGDILQNPIIITDESFNLLGYSSNCEVNDPIWNEIVTNGYCPFDIVRVLKSEGFLNQLKKIESPVFLSVGRFSNFIRRLVCEVRIDGKIKGYIALLEYDHTICDLDKEILKYVSAIVALELAKSNAIERAKGNMEREIIRDLVKGSINNEKNAENRVKSLDWKFFKLLKVFLIRQEKGTIICGHHFDDIQSLIAKSIPGSKVNFTPSEIVILATANYLEDFEKVILNLEDYCGNNALILGVGRSYNKFLDVSTSYQEARKALELSNRLTQKRIVYNYEHMMLYDMISKVKGDEFIHPNLLLLQDYDRNESTEYIKTLKVYFKNRHNLSQTAEELFVHRNTISYRLNKIEGILGCNLNDYQSSLQIQMGLIFLEMQ